MNPFAPMNEVEELHLRALAICVRRRRLAAGLTQERLASCAGPFPKSGGQESEVRNQKSEVRSRTDQVPPLTADRFTFAIPMGEPGPTGPQESQGEVSNADLFNAIQTTSANSNGVSPLSISINDPPTQSEVQAIVNKLDELINALRRNP